MDAERLERITAPEGESPILGEDDGRLRDAWLVLAGELRGSSQLDGAAPDADDVYAEILRRERRSRRMFWRNGAVAAACLLLMAAVVTYSARPRDHGAKEIVGRPPASAADALVWDDDWEWTAEALETDLQLC